MHRRGFEAVLIGLAIAWCLLGDSLSRQLGSGSAIVFREVLGTFRDPLTQWMVFGCMVSYFVTFGLLRGFLGGTAAGAERGSGYVLAESSVCNAWSFRAPGDHWVTRIGSSLPRLPPATLWLAGLVVLTGVAYTLHYVQAAESTRALSLLGGALLGQAVAFFQSRKLKAESRNSCTGIVLTLIILLAIAAAWQGEAGRLFQYRGQARWSGPWDNPNTFGMLMGVGFVLAVGSLKFRVQSLKSSGQGPESEVQSPMSKAQSLRSAEHPTSNIQHRTSNIELASLVKTSAFAGGDGGDGSGAGEEL